MRKQIYSLLLSVLLSIPLGMKATIVDDPGVFNFAPFYDPSSGVIGLSLTFFPSEEGDTVYIPDYIYENNQYKYVVNINTGAFYDCHAKYIRLPNHLRFIQDYAFHYCCFLTTLEFTNDISEIDFGEIDDIVGGCNYVDEIIVPLEYLGNYIDDPEDRFFPYYLDEQLKSKIVLSDYNKMIAKTKTPLTYGEFDGQNTADLIKLNEMIAEKVTVREMKNITNSKILPENGGTGYLGTGKQYLLDSISHHKLFEKYNLLDKNGLKKFKNLCRKVRP